MERMHTGSARATTMHRKLALVAALLFAGSATAAGVDYAALEQHTVGAHRSAEQRARNEYRHPVQTLSWFGVEPDMTVVEIWPGGGGWYTGILAPYLRGSGTFHAAGFVVEGPDVPDFRKRFQRNFEAKLAQRPGIYDEARLAPIGPPDHFTPAPPGSADRVLTFRNVHNWVAGGYARKMFDGFHAMLKPGGILGVVEHRADPGTDLATMKASGYVTEAHVKKLAAEAGLEFVASSPVNDNPADDHDHPEGVWTLPPSLRLGDENRRKYKAIGESDRMTLKFRRPVD